jgi:hypothetical protein
LTTLIIAVHDLSQEHINFTDLFELLPSTVKTLVCEVGGGNIEEQWLYLAEHAQPIRDVDMDITVTPLWLVSPAPNKGELIARMQVLKKFVTTRVHMLGIVFRLEMLRGEYRCSGIFHGN